MIFRKSLFMGLAVVLLLSSSCTKEGPGGNATITGHVTVRYYDRSFRVFQGTSPAVEEDVYIIYGTGDDVSDDTKTGPDGTFRFRFLNKGDYRIFVYSKDSLSYPAKTRPVSQTVTLTSNKGTVDVGEMVIYKNLDVDDGHALLQGKVYQVNWSKNFDYIIDTTFAYDMPAYLVYEDDASYSDRRRVLDDGTVAFPGLIMGKYKVIVYSEDRNDNGALIPISVTMTIDQPFQQVDFGKIYIDKKK